MTGYLLLGSTDNERNHSHKSGSDINEVPHPGEHLVSAVFRNAVNVDAISSYNAGRRTPIVLSSRRYSRTCAAQSASCFSQTERNSSWTFMMAGSCANSCVDRRVFGWDLLNSSQLAMKALRGAAADSAHFVIRDSQERFKSSSML